MANPFKPKSKQYQDFETMKDLKWHCTKYELKSGQAKTWQVWRGNKNDTLPRQQIHGNGRGAGQQNILRVADTVQIRYADHISPDVVLEQFRSHIIDILNGGKVNV